MESEETSDILSNSNNVIYLFECEKCQFKFPYVGITVTKFRFRFNNYKSTYRKFRRKLNEGIIQEIKKRWIKKNCFMNIFRWAWGYCKLVHHFDRPGWRQEGVEKERIIPDKQVEYL